MDVNCDDLTCSTDLVKNSKLVTKCLVIFHNQKTNQHLFLVFALSLTYLVDLEFSLVMKILYCGNMKVIMEK